jgi:hypothetical protein
MQFSNSSDSQALTSRRLWQVEPKLQYLSPDRKFNRAIHFGKNYRQKRMTIYYLVTGFGTGIFPVGPGFGEYSILISQYSIENEHIYP